MKSFWKKPKNISPTMKAECPESALQSYADDLLAWKKIWFIRFPDGFLRWMKLHAPAHIQAIFFNQVGGKLPDNLIMIPIAPGMFLAAKLELKTQDSKGREVGKLHGKQKRYATEEEWMIARSPEQIDRAVEMVEGIAEKIKLELSMQDQEKIIKENKNNS